MEHNQLVAGNNQLREMMIDLIEGSERRICEEALENFGELDEQLEELRVDVRCLMDVVQGLRQERRTVRS